MADLNKPSSAPNTAADALREFHKRIHATLSMLAKQLNTKTATAALALLVWASWAHAQITPVSPSTSASATVDKGGWQRVILKDGRVMSFGDIGKLSKEEKAEVLDNQMTDEQYTRWEAYQKWNIKAANQEAEKFAEKRQAANQLNEWKREQLISKYEQYIANIERGARWDRKTVESIANAEISPDELKARANALLNRRDIILAGI